ncbi:putative membrane protein [Paenibacillus cellulosilyticus]|uniref:Putative membrane protein n=1 Tax=Paenibacillus cellulosilyticus TaxID=375489 RepID=A0A2V2YVN6_9BACL|nr:hypothetical protein [Paenibacillus cellulosilyticus]PWW05041.1 putative membrane protein [Paenibacillus cellulosilyticus]QKS48598.1 hypothetical protein HUB94_30790 [Paenibacillus cellulosilyticus]
MQEMPVHSFDQADVQSNKGMAIVAYIIFFIPLLAAPNSAFARYHANQGLTLFITCVALNIVLGIIPIIGWLLLPFANLGCLALAVIGIASAAQGGAKPLPVIGKYTLIK